MVSHDFHLPDLDQGAGHPEREGTLKKMDVGEKGRETELLQPGWNWGLGRNFKRVFI
jgi:hypothetical protein